jgi:quercetin dioxygenase-like cupin family protein
MLGGRGVKSQVDEKNCNTMKIEKSGARPSRRGPSEWFTGAVWVDEIVLPEAPARLHALTVFFEPGARTAWHSHPLGQTLHILSGLGRVQKAGEPAIDVRPGDTVSFAPGERHWHGSAPGHTMTHLAVHRAADDGVEVTWFEQVSEAEYLGR